jgi:hypothetical protein
MPDRRKIGETAAERSKAKRKYGAVESRKKATPVTPRRKPTRRKTEVSPDTKSKAAQLRADARRHTKATEKGIRGKEKAKVAVDYSKPEQELKKAKASKVQPMKRQDSNANKAAKGEDKSKKKLSAFGAAFAKARAAGRKTFEWNDNTYTTKRKDDKKTTAPVPKRKPSASKPKKDTTQKPKEATSPPKDITRKAPPKDPPKRNPRRKMTKRGKRILTPRRKRNSAGTPVGRGDR